MSNDVFVGLDWAVHTHAVCVIDAAGSVLERLEVTHDRDGLAELMRRLRRHGARLRIDDQARGPLDGDAQHVATAPVVPHQVDRAVDALQFTCEPVAIRIRRGREARRYRRAEAWR